EPVRGGTLAKLPERISHFFTDADPDASTASWAIRFAASLDGVITVLSGMSNIEQMADNLSFMENFKPLDEGEREVIAKVQKALDDTPYIRCTYCRYCVKGCPADIRIPDIFGSMNNYLIYEDMAAAKGNYAWNTRHGVKASDCLQCGQCESVCPQKLTIIDNLKKAVEMFE
ncbi:MAG: 4Fe-4S dicluster domain-containing protein, partial [Clostridia bacterium]|nr:4Fe-4S dicluster domain-containing protein [Clostridia bacterium]